MLIKIALLLSIILQLIASILSISLLKRTRFNVAWVLLSIGFCCMAIQRIYDLIYVSTMMNAAQIDQMSIISCWFSVLISFLIFIGIVYIKKLFNYMKRMEKMAAQNENKIFTAIIRTEENERQYFAKELHDGLGPILSSIKMAFSALSKDVTNDSNKQIVLKTNFAIDEAIITIKEISNKLSPHILANFGIERAVKAFIDTVMIKQNEEIKFESNLKDIRYDFNIETVIYRIVCELVTNTVRHAQAQKINIALRQKDGFLSLDYSDDGIGFNLEEINQEHKGLGLSNMESRVKSINGAIAIASSPNNGMKVSINVRI